VSAIHLLKWLLISLNTEKLCSASADVASRVHPNTSQIIMFGKEPGFSCGRRRNQQKTTVEHNGQRHITQMLKDE